MYFDSCTTLDELKKEYRRLVMLHHPDRGGDTRIMQEINSEHDRVFKRLQKVNNQYAEEKREGYHYNRETPEQFRHIIEYLMLLDDIQVEICGSWLWIVSPKKNADALKKIGCRWSANKRRWYWYEGIKYSRYQKSKNHVLTMQEIRDAYGSQYVEESRRQESGITR